MSNSHWHTLVITFLTVKYVYVFVCLSYGNSWVINLYFEVFWRWIPIIDSVQLYYNFLTFQAAYRDNTLGLPKICPKENIDKIDTKSMYSFMKNFHDPSRMVLCGVGMEHDTLVEMARDIFVKKTPIWIENPSLVDPSKSVDNSVSQYTGGKMLVSKHLIRE